MKKYLITVNGNQYEVEVEEMPAGSGEAMVQATEQPKTVMPAAKSETLSTKQEPKVVQTPSTPVSAPLPETAPAPASAKKGSEIVTSPMPGTILKIEVTPGQEIKKGQILCILEAMKMENEIVASRDARIAEVIVTKGASVNAGDPLISFE